MAHIKMSELDDNFLFTFDMEVDFENALSFSERADVFQIVTRCLSEEILRKLFVGLTSAEVSVKQNALQIKFTFYVDKANDEVNRLLKYEYFGNQRVNLYYYIFAQVNKSYKMIEAPFISHFDHFIDYITHLEESNFGAIGDND